jgi:hypothetical protein
MVIGGVLLGAGMVLELEFNGVVVSFTLRRAYSFGDFVILEGMQHPTPTTPWREMRFQVRTDALRLAVAPPSL